MAEYGTEYDFRDSLFCGSAWLCELKNNKSQYLNER
jgi:hypothetical protein